MSDRVDVAPLSPNDRWASAVRSEEPKAPSMRVFGIVILIGFGVLAALSYAGGLRSGARWRLYLAGLLGAIAIVVFLWAMVMPRTLPPVYRAWMNLGQGIGAVVSTVLLGLTYFIVAAPVGLLMRAFGTDPLDRRIVRDSTASYWTPRTRSADPQDYHHMS